MKVWKVMLSYERLFSAIKNISDNIYWNFCFFLTKLCLRSICHSWLQRPDRSVGSRHSFVHTVHRLVAMELTVIANFSITHPGIYKYACASDSGWANFK
jgi:hypothetical protein